MSHLTQEPVNPVSNRQKYEVYNRGLRTRDQEYRLSRFDMRNSSKIYIFEKENRKFICII